MVSMKNSSCAARIWDLGAGDTFRGRTVATIRGIVGLAHNPVAIIFFAGDNDHPARCAAAYSEALQHGDEVSMRVSRDRGRYLYADHIYVTETSLPSTRRPFHDIPGMW